jgi:hypothetical protein
MDDWATTALISQRPEGWLRTSDGSHPSSTRAIHGPLQANTMARILFAMHHLNKGGDPFRIGTGGGYG